ncbi:lycopene cyclase domain-containing protein [Pedobacter boryungensis]|uniref:Lycopene cyclase domain-containing protein n=1 Tax=Pedobacter boryungensis TaxID=869962 RepID=A0ABX2DAL0_9SPHI|nr:lycopene cyclase domain-containing protein [Pedobacter boryungensis]NQX30624.1 lycopene cyclase domain-containing protein [Pedobacter boryungensis]
MRNYTYLLVDFFTIVVPFVFSFHQKLQFYKTWKAFFPAVILTGLLFMLWDIYFTKLGVWGFNSNYIVGWKLWGLPIEELLFFLCIPYSCVFTYHCLTLLMKLKLSRAVEDIITYSLMFLGVLGVIYYWGNYYTVSTGLLMIGLLILSKLVLKVEWLGKFYIVYLVLMIPFCIVNGILTGTGLNEPVVWYNAKHIIGFRILTIPFEDIFYGLDLILLNLLIFHSLKSSLLKFKQV